MNLVPQFFYLNLVPILRNLMQSSPFR